MEKIKLDWVNNGIEFEIPDITNNKDVQIILDLLCINKDIEIKYQKYKPKGDRPDLEKNSELPDDWFFYFNIISTQMSLDRAYYMLHKIDKNVTKEQVSGMGVQWIADFNMKLFPKNDEMVFQEAEKTAKKPIVEPKKKN